MQSCYSRPRTAGLHWRPAKARNSRTLMASKSSRPRNISSICWDPEERWIGGHAKSSTGSLCTITTWRFTPGVFPRWDLRMVRTCTPAPGRTSRCKAPYGYGKTHERVCQLPAQQGACQFEIARTRARLGLPASPVLDLIPKLGRRPEHPRWQQQCSREQEPRGSKHGRTISRESARLGHHRTATPRSRFGSHRDLRSRET